LYFYITFLLYQGLKTNQLKLSNFNHSDVLKIKGTLHTKPKYFSGLKQSKSLTLSLKEYPETEFKNSGIYVYPLNIQEVISQSNINDTVILLIPKQEINSFSFKNQEFSFYALTINNHDYATLSMYNKLFSEERPFQYTFSVYIIAILGIIILVQFIVIFGKSG
jgi:hypothetical protein